MQVSILAKAIVIFLVTKVTFTELVKIMVDYDMKLKDIAPKGEGIEVSRLKGFNYTNHDYSFHEKLREGC